MDELTLVSELDIVAAARVTGVIANAVSVGVPPLVLKCIERVVHQRRNQERGREALVRSKNTRREVVTAAEFVGERRQGRPSPRRRKKVGRILIGHVRNGVEPAGLNVAPVRHVVVPEVDEVKGMFRGGVVIEVAQHVVAVPVRTLQK